MAAALPRAELCAYTGVLGAALLWAASWVAAVSEEHGGHFKEGLQDGWSYFGRKRDIADFEWLMWFSKWRNYILLALSGQVLFGKFASLLFPERRSLVYMVYGMLVVTATMGLQYVLLVASHCLLLYSVGLAKQRWLCFLAGLASLATFRAEPFNSWQNGFVSGDFQLQDVLFAGGSAFTIVRCLSFALDNCDYKDGSYSFLDLLKYNFYLPFFFFGPVMVYDKFHEQVNDSSLARKEHELWGINMGVCGHLLVVLLVDILFHFLYIVTIPADLSLLEDTSDWGLAFLAYANLVYDWVKAAMLFGVVCTVARLDHFDPPKRPKCITMLYVFADTHFDRGINDFLCKYIYDRYGVNHDNILRELLGTVATFAFATLWLGPCDVVYLWSFLNCLGLNLELWVQKLFALPALTQIEGKQLTPEWSRRVRAIFGAANYWTIILYNVLALNSTDFAELVSCRILLYGFPFTTIMVWFITYCGVQLVMEKDRLDAVKEKTE
ncbi:protein-cysteine N-palmitoyltransferase HHAT-like protein [Petromyzon marinus]|uniref:Protein-cysteine N-palmitoyltransferase HHAT-like protein n=1 Tax=Petromyzon marinus TaxID=7757 RepID=A0AAJ7X563_PETMA|nr:protein-cysteine N-palmitoyltransferase HHAT-like protein [Petromyzon marinus]